MKYKLLHFLSKINNYESYYACYAYKTIFAIRLAFSKHMDTITTS